MLYIMYVLLILPLVYSLIDAQIINPGGAGTGKNTTSQCPLKPADIIFVLDDSASVGYENFRKEVEFVKTFAREFDIGPSNVQIGVVAYSFSANEYIKLNSNRDKLSLISSITSLPYLSGLTYTADAINFTTHTAFSQSHGDRDSVTDVMMVITNGQSKNPSATAAAAGKAHTAGIITYAIGVGSNVNTQEMNSIASDKNHVFYVSNSNALQQLKEELKNKTCEAQGSPSPPNTSMTSLANTSTIAPLVTVFVGICRDEFGNCQAYRHSVCSNYRPWSVQNCAQFCGFCKAPPTPPPLPQGGCIDNLPIGTCETYGLDICQKYREWASRKCPKFCSLCQAPTTELPCLNVDINCHTIGPGVCYQNRSWAEQNCRKFCAFCSASAIINSGPLSLTTQGTTQVPPTCSSSPSDILVLLDTEFDSVDDFNLQKTFLYRFVYSLDYGDREVRLGVAVSSQTNESRIFLGQYHTKADIVAKIGLLPYHANNQNSSQGIAQIINEMFTTSHGDRKHVPNIVVMITDGQSGHSQKDLTQGLQQNDVTVLAIGVGQNTSDSQLQDFVIQKSDAFHVNTIGDIMDISDAFKQQYCEVITRTCADDSKSICHDNNVCSIQTSQMMCRSTCKLR